MFRSMWWIFIPPQGTSLTNALNPVLARDINLLSTVLPYRGKKSLAHCI